MFFKFLPQLLRATYVTLLTAFVTAANQHYDLPALQPIIDTESGTKCDSQLIHAATHEFAIAEVSSAHTRQTGVHRRLHPQIAKGIKPLVKRDESILKFQLLDFLLKHFECNL